jgi:hypothetical protein
VRGNKCLGRAISHAVQMSHCLLVPPPRFAKIDVWALKVRMVLNHLLNSSAWSRVRNMQYLQIHSLFHAKTYPRIISICLSLLKMQDCPEERYNEKTFHELQTRLPKTIAILETVKKEDLTSMRTMKSCFLLGTRAS